MPFCPNCGNQIPEGSRFCPSCGQPFAPVQTRSAAQYADPVDYSYGNQQGFQDANYNVNNYTINNYNTNMPAAMIQPRNIVMCIILSIVTCGIYGIIWMIKANDQINYLANEPTATSGGLVILYTFLTCGIYGFFWYYNMGNRCDRIERMNGSKGIMFLVFGLFGLGIVSMCLMQDTINKAVSYNGYNY